MSNDDPIQKAISSAKVHLFMRQPFYGSIMMNLDSVDASKWCRSFTTDGAKFYYNRDFIKSLKRPELVWVLGHVVGHIVFNHLGRKGNRDANRWGAATDYLNNFVLEKELVEQYKIAQRPKMDGIFYDIRYNDDLTSDQIYEDLEKNSIEVEVGIDDHLDLGDDQKGEKVKVTIQGGPDGPPSMTQDDLDLLRDKIRQQVMVAAKTAGAGKTPGAILRMIEEFTNPVMDWVTLLEMEIQSTVKDDFTFLNPSKRSWAIPPIKNKDGTIVDNGLAGTGIGSGIILPGHNFKNSIDIAFVIDASGSMSDEMVADALSELKGIVEMYEDFKVTVWSFDTDVYNPKIFTPQNIDEIYDYGLVGRGGTDFMVNWEFMKDPTGWNFEGFEDEIMPKKLVFFTDGYPCGDWGDEMWCDTLWIIHGNDQIVAPWGKTAYYQDEEKRKQMKNH